MKAGEDNTKLYEVAMQLRAVLCELFGAQEPRRLALAPGILVGLQILFANLGVRSIVLTSGEYYSRVHFLGLSTGTFSVESLVQEVKLSQPDAVIASVVTWRGRVLPVAKLFGEIRATLGKRAPILIADYSHAGAAGFPPMGELEADIVCGDPAKWVLQQHWVSTLAFFCFQSGSLFAKAKRALEPFFLATSDQGNQFFARWIDPQDVQDALGAIAEERLNRAALLKRYRENMSLTFELAAQLGIKHSLDSSIIWSDEERLSETLPSWLRESGLVWNPPTGGTRILCRAEAQPYRKYSQVPFA